MTTDASNPTPTTAARLGRIYESALRFGQWLAVAGILYALVSYFVSSAPGYLGIAGGALLAFLLIRAASRRYPDNPAASALLAGLGVIVSHFARELFTDGLTLFHLISGVIVLSAIFALVRPLHVRLWLGLLALHALFNQAAALLPRLPVVDPSLLEGQDFASPIFTAAVLLFLLVQIIRNVRIHGLRARMLSTLLLVSFVPVLAVALVTGLFGFQTGRQQVTNQLEAIADLKEAQINAWLDAQRVSFQGISLPGGGARLIEEYLASDPTRASAIVTRNRIIGEFENLLNNNSAFAEVYFADVRGNVVLATSPSRLGNVIAGESYFRSGLIGYNVQAPVFSANLNRPISFLSRPVFNAVNPAPGTQPLGVLIVRLNLFTLDTILTERAGLGQTGETYLVSNRLELLTPASEPVQNPVGFTSVSTTGAVRGNQTRGNGSAVYLNYQDIPVIGVYRWVSSLHTLLLIEQQQEEIFATLRLNVILNVGIAFLTASLALAVAISLAQSISEPIVELASEASRIAAGEIQQIESITRDDEIGDLSKALNTMTARLNDTVDNLETIVADRTAELERRAVYLQAAAEVGQVATQIHRLDDLLTPVAHLISERFGFYHVGIFLLDETREFAVLQASNSEGGWRMLAREHRLKVGEQGIVGYVTSTGLPRIQQHVGEDAVYYANPDLPHTRSEMALPLRAGGELLGALDVQSTEDDAFGPEDSEVLQVLADQVALSIANARLFEQVQHSIEAERRALGQLSREAWVDILQARHITAVHSDARGVSLTQPEWTEEARRALERGQLVHPGLDMERQRYPLAVPVRVRGNIIVGVLETYKPFDQGDWTTQELDALQALSEQLGIALENARLFEQTQRLAQRERIVADVSGKVWSSSDVETILQTAVQELGSALHASQGAIRLRLADQPEADGAANGHGNGAGPVEPAPDEDSE